VATLVFLSLKIPNPLVAKVRTLAENLLCEGLLSRSNMLKKRAGESRVPEASCRSTSIINCRKTSMPIDRAARLKGRPGKDVDVLA
jgi:hypothetical protein